MTDIVTYDLSPEQLDAYEAGEPMVLLVPLHATSPLGKGREFELMQAASSMLPDVSINDIDDARPTHIWADVGSPKPVNRTTLEDVFGTTLRPELAKERPFVSSVYAVVVSIHEGRAERVRGVWPGGAIRLNGEIFFPKSIVEIPEDGPQTKSKKPAIDPDYFVDRDFGGPRE